MILKQLFGWFDSFTCGWMPQGCTNTTGLTNGTDTSDMIEKVLSDIPVSQLVLTAAAMPMAPRWTNCQINAWR